MRFLDEIILDLFSRAYTEKGQKKLETTIYQNVTKRSHLRYMPKKSNFGCTPKKSKFGFVICDINYLKKIIIFDKLDPVRNLDN